MILILVLVGLAAGILSGLVGVGGGVVIVPALVFFLGYSQHQAQGTSLGLLVLPVVFFGFWNYYKQGYVDYKIVLMMAGGFIIGSYFGSKLAISISQELVKKIFAVILFYTAFKMLNWDKAIFGFIKGLFS